MEKEDEVSALRVLENHKFVAHKRQEQNHQQELCGRKGAGEGAPRKNHYPIRLVDGQEHRMRDSLENPNLDVKKASSAGFKNQCNDRGHFQDFCTRKKPHKLSEGSEVASGGGTQVQSNRMETTWTSEHERKKKQNMTTLGHSVWSEESQNHESARLGCYQRTH